jgi:hypothetical protein
MLNKKYNISKKEFLSKIDKIGWIYSVYNFMISYLEEDQIKRIDKRFLLNSMKGLIKL